MKGKLKLWLFGAMSLVGLISCVVVFLYHDVFLATMALVLVCFSTTYFFQERKRLKNPEEYERAHIEQNDERNIFMRYKAGFISGQVLLVVTAIFIALEYYGCVDYRLWTFKSAGFIWMYLQMILYAKYKYL